MFSHIVLAAIAAAVGSAHILTSQSSQDQAVQSAPSVPSVREQSHSHHPDLFFVACNDQNAQETGVQASTLDRLTFGGPLLAELGPATRFLQQEFDRLADLPALRLSKPEVRKPEANKPIALFPKTLPQRRPAITAAPLAAAKPLILALPKRRAAPPVPRAGRLQMAARTTAPFAHAMFCATNRDFCDLKSGPTYVKLSPAKYSQIEKVNQRVNKIIRPRHDSEIGVKDLWQVAVSEGDCEDFALRKFKDLADLGFPKRAMSLATATLPDGQFHAVLIVRTDRGDFVLDSYTKELLGFDQANLKWDSVQSNENPRIWHKVAPKSRKPLALT